MDEKFKRIEAKIDKIEAKLDQTKETLGSVDKSLAIYNEQLKIHIEGTIQNREALRLFQEQVAVDIKPIKRHIHMVEGVIKFIGLTSILVAIVTSIMKVI